MHGQLGRHRQRTSSHRPRTLLLLTIGVLVATLTAGAVGTASGRPQVDPVVAPRILTTPAELIALAAGSAGPAQLKFSTYLGGREWDEANDVEVDERGNIYVTGFTLSRNFPGRAPTGRGGIVDAFVTKLAPGGRRVVWSTRVGGVDLDVGNALAVDQAGNVYVTGRTGSPDFPTLAAMQPVLGGRSCTGEPCHDAFVAKFGPGGRLLFSTYFGGSGSEEGLGIAVDAGGGVYVAGNTDSPDLPTANALQDSFQSLPCEGDLPCPYDVFVTKLTPTGTSLAYSTYLGGEATEVTAGLTVDDAGNAYVTGTTRSPDFPTVNAVQPTLRGVACGPPPGEPCPDAFATKLTPDGNAAVYSTLLGGRQTETGGGIAVDDAGSVYLTGSTQSPDFPTAHPAQPRLHNRACTDVRPEEQCNDGFATKLGPSGARIRYSTYLGGRAEDQGLAIDVDAAGNAYLTGRTDSTTFPSRGAVQPRFGGYIDGFVTKLSAAGEAVTRSTFLGGSDADRSTAVAVDATGAVHVVGRTLSTDFPTAGPLQPSLHDDDYDAFLTIID